MKYEIMLKILFDLLSKKSVTAKYLSLKYGVCVRTIYRYIDCLESSGVPLYTDRGKDGGIKIVDTYKFSSTFMSIDEFEHTISALKAINESMPDAVLDSAINKLKSAIKNEYSGFDIKSGNLIIDGGPWGDTVGYKSKLKIIQMSIEQNKKLFIKYCDRNGEKTERTIEPHLIVFKQGIWYVYAYCNLRKDFRFFKTGRIESAEITKEIFIRQDLSKKNLPLDFWHNSVKAYPIEMEIKKSVLSEIEEWLGVENIDRIGDKYIAKVSLPVDGGLYSKIMSYGNGIKVISPTNLREKIKNCAKELIDSYE